MLEGVARRETATAAERVLTPGAVEFVSWLHREFEPRRLELLQSRELRQAQLNAGMRPDFLAATAPIRASNWQVAQAPAELIDRRVELLAPAERRTMINALNSGANLYVADLEDSVSPTWANLLAAQINLQDAVRGTLATGTKSRRYRLDQKTAALALRPRGWHLLEKHLAVDGQILSATLFDFGLFFYHNAHELVARGKAPHIYLPKLESHTEARLWNDVLVASQEALAIPRGTARATVLIESILAAFEMEEILHELREHAAGLSAGRWDYIFSAIQKFGSDFVLPDRPQVVMEVPFLSAFTDLLVKTCHRRGAFAIGGSAREQALYSVRADKERECEQGFDGTTVTQAGLVPAVHAIFNTRLVGEPNQLHVLRPEVWVRAADLLDLHVEGGSITRAGVTACISVALQYLDAWLRGIGELAINGEIENSATFEVARAQLWQWRKHRVRLANGERVTAELYHELRDQELQRLEAHPANQSRLADAAQLLDQLVLCEASIPSFALLAYERLD